MSIQHRLATPVIQPRMRFFDTDGKPLVGGKVYAFKVGTDKFKPTYRNSELTALNTNPVVLDGAGSALIYLRGANLLKIYDRHGNFIEERIEYQQRERAQFYDDYGRPLKNGYVYTYDYQSTIKKTSYSIDNVINPNPIVLDEKGTALVNIVGAYRLRQYNSKNVFVGDQDFKRPPVKALTSVIYPLYLDEDIASNFSVLDAKYSGADTQEEIRTEFTVLSPVRIDSVIYSDYAMEPEHLSTEFAVLSPVRINAVIYSEYNMEPENLATTFSVANPVRQVLLLRYEMEPESISTQFSVLNPIRK